VCSVDALASSAGVAMLRAGGSAVDAAVAASAVLAVTSQHLCGMGGDLFALVYRSSVDAAAGPAVLNASGRAGSGASAARLRDEGYTTMPFRGDVRSAPVPGCVDGWVTLHERFGRLPLADVLAPAVGYAADGFPASPTLVARVPAIEGVVGADDYVGGGRRVRTGTLIRRPGVARTLTAIGSGGRGAFYEGEFGAGLLEVGGGEYTADDLAASQADWVEPAFVDVWSRRVWTVPPNSQGYLTLAGAWIASGLPALAGADPDDPAWAHLLIESARQAAFDRLAVLSEDADWRTLVSPARLMPRRDAISVDGVSSVAFAPMPGGTMYLCAVDADRMGVSLIQSNASGWGCHVVEPSTRIFLHNRGIGFSLDPGHPAEYAPGRRPPHTLSPALVTDPSTGLLDVVLGTMGGDSQPQVLLQLLARLLGRSSSESVASAIAAGRWVLRPGGEASGFDTWAAGDGRVRVDVEGHAAAAWDDGLRALGHDVTRVEAWDAGFGHAHAIRLLDGGEVLAGAADPRTRSSDAAGW
jgi:gamma-glutamyltranspeptidase/glutathione hydrolase